jgi:5-methylcytosine-specific restriction enzyme B
MYITRNTLQKAVRELYGKANHYLKLWFVLKHMGPNASLERLFSFGDSDGKFYVPFAHSARWLTMMGDAGRSVIQTTISNWLKKSIVTCDPTGFLNIVATQEAKYAVSPGRMYPIGLGVGPNGFSLEENTRVSVPAIAFAVWYGRQSEIPKGTEPIAFLLRQMLTELNISQPEQECVFVDQPFGIELTPHKLSDREINQVCQEFLSSPGSPTSALLQESAETHTRKVKSMVTIDDRPAWLKYSPGKVLKELIDSGSRAVILYGPPRTGKTWLVDQLIARTHSDRETIQIHDGWDYEHLIQGKQPDSTGKFVWVDGPLKVAIQGGKRIIVLEEINRTLFSQSLGEVFSLLEQKYRGKDNAIRLRSGENFHIPKETVFIMTMNTIDKSTEEIDDALLGRVDGIEFLPKVEDLTDILAANKIPEEVASKLRALFVAILDIYPLGQGYFSQFTSGSEPLSYYVSKIRPVLSNHLSSTRAEDLAQMDNLVDNLFGIKT